MNIKHLSTGLLKFLCLSVSGEMNYSRETDVHLAAAPWARPCEGPSDLVVVSKGVGVSETWVCVLTYHLLCHFMYSFHHFLTGKMEITIVLNSKDESYDCCEDYVIQSTTARVEETLQEE